MSAEAGPTYEIVAELPDEFIAADLDDLPTIHSMGGDGGAALWVLFVARTRLGHPWLTAGDVSNVIRDVYGWYAPRDEILRLLLSETSAVTVSEKAGSFAFQVTESLVESLRRPPRDPSG